jgi:ubiquinone/menaquinone biosynthesis C-methylase UbiE
MTLTDLDRWEAAYRRFETPREEVRKFTRRLRRFGAHRWPRDAAMLELFCGRGNGMVALEQLGFTRISGVDLSPRLVREYRGRARCVVGDCRRLPVRDGSHDVAIVQGGLHHLLHLPDDLAGVVAEVRRVLRPGGMFVVVEPWQTPFLTLAHGVSSIGWVRRVSRKLDALAEMTDLEGEVYWRWLQQPDTITGQLRRHFEPLMDERRWGKLLFLGRKAD